MTSDEQCHGESPLITADASDEPTGRVVVDAVAAVSNTAVEGLTPIFEVVDPDALDALFTQSSTGRATFEYEGYGVCVFADGTVAISDLADTPMKH